MPPYDSMSANAETMLVKSQLEDGLEDDKQSQKNVLLPEAQCISNILRNCISNAESAAVLPIVLQLNLASSVESKELSTSLQRHQMLEERLNMLGDLKPVSDGVQEKRKNTRVQLEEKIKDSFRNILRHLRACSDIIFNWKEELEREVGTSEKALIQELKKFHSQVLDKLQTSCDKEPQLTSSNQVSLSSDRDVQPTVSPQDFPAAIKEVNAKVRPPAGKNLVCLHVAREVTHLSAFLFVQQISQKNQQIQSLQSFLQEKKKKASTLAKQHQSIIEASEETQSRVQQEIDQLTAQLNSLILGDRQAERALQEVFLTTFYRKCVTFTFH